MPRHHLTLAALATSAMPGLDVAQAQPFTGGGEGDFDSALLTTKDGQHLVVRVPTSAAADRAQSAEVGALAAMTGGVRARLPFAVSTIRGTGVVGGRGSGPLAVVRDYLPGQRIRLDAVHASGTLSRSIGDAIAAIHALPTGVVADAGLPVQTPTDVMKAVSDLVSRAAASGRVPALLVGRWRGALADASVWQFRPTVIHGGLAVDTLLSAHRGTPEERIVGVLSWGGLSVGDPARDLSWALSLRGEAAAGSVYAAYSRARRGGVDRELRQRSMLYAELEIARWLLFGLESADADVIRDAEAMLTTLLHSVQDDTAGSLLHETMPSLSVDQVERLLDDQRRTVLDTTGPIAVDVRATYLPGRHSPSAHSPGAHSPSDAVTSDASQSASSSSSDAMRSGRTTRSSAT